jgi:hypothetical protein
MNKAAVGTGSRRGGQDLQSRITEARREFVVNLKKIRHGGTVAIHLWPNTERNVVSHYSVVPLP